MNRLIPALMASFMALAPAAAQKSENKEDVCSYYGNVGAAAIEFLLPLKFGDVVDMVSGKNTELLKQMSEAVERKGSSKVKVSIGKISDDALELLGEAAGFHSFQLALTGQATSGKEIFGRLASQCMNTSPQAIIENQRRARAVEPAQ